MIQRRKTKQIEIGNIKIGGSAPISVQSMTNTDTRDIKSTLKQINNLSELGCELVRLAILNPEAAEAIKEIKKKSPIPLIADIHFDYRLAIKCIENGIDNNCIQWRGNNEDKCLRCVDGMYYNEETNQCENGNGMEKYLLLSNRQCIEMIFLHNECCFQ